MCTHIYIFGKFPFIILRRSAGIIHKVPCPCYVCLPFEEKHILFSILLSLNRHLTCNNHTLNTLFSLYMRGLKNVEISWLQDFFNLPSQIYHIDVLISVLINCNYLTNSPEWAVSIFFTLRCICFSDMGSLPLEVANFFNRLD